MTNSKRRLILVANDDGVQARGLHSLIEIVKPYGDLVVVAPEQHQSGMSHSISLLKPLTANLVQKEEGLLFYSIPGTPVDCVKFALNKLVTRKPDLMVSGINHGSNSAISVIYSGTMGAAIEASLYGIPSIGLSLLDHSADANFELIEKHAKTVIDKVLENGLSPNISLNINYPNINLKDFKGYKVCRQTKGMWQEDFEERTHPYGVKYYWLTGNFNNLEPDAEDSDEWALKNNYAAIVPVHADLTHYKEFERLKSWNL
ncbi:MAG: 5'/3'-nucleotidase SurE [Bacteroidales bacterium]|nr:5'/3'-nucleotidase SurE [Bacteroidales bacterium]